MLSEEDRRIMIPLVFQKRNVRNHRVWISMKMNYYLAHGNKHNVILGDKDLHRNVFSGFKRIKGKSGIAASINDILDAIKVKGIIGSPIYRIHDNHKFKQIHISFYHSEIDKK